MAYWIVKSEPTVYSFTNLLVDKKTTWNGVRNPQALIYLRSMRKGDLAMYYHSNEGKCIVGMAEIVSEPYADPDEADPKLVVVDLIPKRKFLREVSLVEIKANPRLSELKLVTQARLSVSPVPDDAWKELLRMAGEK